MRSVNKVVLMGYLATDPEEKTTQNGHHLATFKLATNRDYTSSDGKHHQTADFHKIIVWSKLAEICGQYLKKGCAVYVEGHLANRLFKDAQGNDRKSTEIVADVINFITYHKGKDGEEINLIEVPV